MQYFGYLLPRLRCKENLYIVYRCYQPGQWHVALQLISCRTTRGCRSCLVKIGAKKEAARKRTARRWDKARAGRKKREKVKYVVVMKREKAIDAMLKR